MSFKILLSFIVIFIYCIVSYAEDVVFSDECGEPKTWGLRPGITSELIGSGQNQSLKFSGVQKSNWNYNHSKSISLNPGKKYKISVRIKVNIVEPAFPPSLKMEFVPAKGKKDLGRVETNQYDLNRGGWQTLTGEFQTPAWSDGGWLAVEKGTDKPVKISFLMDWVKLEELSRFTYLDKLNFKKVPEGLQNAQNIHPRIYLTPKKLADLCQVVKNNAKYAELLKVLLKNADDLVKDGPHKYIKHDRYSGDEQLWQRPVGNAMPILALAYLLTKKDKYMTACTKYMLASCSYPTWGVGRIDGRDLATGHQLFGLALAYDWLYNNLSEEIKQKVRKCLIKRASFLFAEAATGQIWWCKSNLQNHQWVNLTGLAAAGCALYGEVKGIDGWINLPLFKIRKTMESLGSDGASHEGVPYWSYGVENLLKFAEIAKTLLDEDLLKNSRWFQETAFFRIYASLPRDYWKKRSTLISYADGPRSDWYGPDYLLRKLASEYRNGYAQTLADELDKSGFVGRSACFLNLLWYDKTVAPLPLASLPVSHYFDDMGLVFMRTGWDGKENVSSFKCGAFIGKHALKLYFYDPGGGHVHPDAGAFQIFANGEWLIVDDGYAFKQTVYQNTVLVNGVGQTGEGRAWFNGSSLCVENRAPEIIKTVFTKEYDWVLGDVTDAYDKKTGLIKFYRLFIFLKPDIWVVVDLLETKKTSRFEQFFHSDYKFVETKKKHYILKGKNGGLLFLSVAPEEIRAQAFMQQIKNVGNKASRTIPCLKISNANLSNQELFINVLYSFPEGNKKNPEITASFDGTLIKINTQETTWRITINKQTLIPEKISRSK